MKMLLRLIAAFLLLQVVSAASLNDAGDSKNRILQGQKLSEKEHDDGENFDYDHEAFLGADEAHEFDDLDPEESKTRLSAIVDKIDTDSDGFVTLDEMRQWIHFAQDRYTTQDVEKQWAQHNPEAKEGMDWEAYRKLVYGFLDLDDGAKDEEHQEGGDQASYKQMEARDRRRWDMADENGDGSLSKYEFKHYLHPEEVEHMRDIVIEETMEDIDKDGDGRLSEDEYIGDMYRGGDSPPGEDEEPDWVKRERENFKEVRDQDGDGYMSQEEVRAWVMPPDFDHADAEARHLMTESDTDDDGKLTKVEILDKYDLFVGSQATDFGEALTHDEF